MLYSTVIAVLRAARPLSGFEPKTMDLYSTQYSRAVICLGFGFSTPLTLNCPGSQPAQWTISSALLHFIALTLARV